MTNIAIPAPLTSFSFPFSFPGRGGGPIPRKKWLLREEHQLILDDLYQEKNISLTILKNKYIKAGQKNKRILQDYPFIEALTNYFPCDAHFTLYNSDIRLFKKESSFKLFRFVFIDFDTVHHIQLEKSKYEIILDAVWPSLGKYNLIPNFSYKTIHGFRFIYIINELVDSGLIYEACYKNFQKVLINRCSKLFNGIMEIDTKTNDWTRLFRLPNVLRDKERTEENVYYYHFKKMNFLAFKGRTENEQIGMKNYILSQMRNIVDSWNIIDSSKKSAMDLIDKLYFEGVTEKSMLITLVRRWNRKGNHKRAEKELYEMINNVIARNRKKIK